MYPYRIGRTIPQANYTLDLNNPIFFVGLTDKQEKGLLRLYAIMKMSGVSFYDWDLPEATKYLKPDDFRRWIGPEIDTAYALSQQITSGSEIFVHGRFPVDKSPTQMLDLYCRWVALLCEISDTPYDNIVTVLSFNRLFRELLDKCEPVRLQRLEQERRDEIAKLPPGYHFRR